MTDQFIWVDGSPSAAENPPHDARWRAHIAERVREWPAVVVRNIGLDFRLETARRQIDLDNLFRLAVAGLRDAGAITSLSGALDEVVATKRVGQPIGLAISLIVAPRPAESSMFETVDASIESSVIPREGRVDEKRVWREEVRSAHSAVPGQGPVAIDITLRTEHSLVNLLKPIIDGLEAYLGRGRLGGREFTPLDDRIVLLGARRDLAMEPALRVVLGTPAAGSAYRAVPTIPGSPELDAYGYSLDDLERIERRSAWIHTFTDKASW